MKKISKIMGIVVTIALLISMVVSTVPASARPLAFSAETDIPKAVDYTLLAGSDVVDMAVNGDTVYAATSVIAVGLVKSIDGGATWTSLASSTFYPTDNVTKVAVSPDDPNVLVISTDVNKVYYSENGGAMWSNLNQPGVGTTSALAISDIDVSVGPLRNVVAAGNNGTTAKMFTMLLAMAQSWSERASTANGFANAVTNNVAVKFSPNYQTDKIIGVVSTNATASCFQVYWGESFKWNSQVTGFDANYPVAVQGTVAIPSAVAASIAFPDTYIGTDYSSRVVYVSLADAATAGGVFRMSDYSIGAGGTFTTWSGAAAGPVGSIAYHEAGKLLVGSYNDNKVYTSLAPTAAFPKFEREKLFKQPSGANKTIVGWAGDTAVAATSGADSGFSMSMDDGVTFNDYGLMDTTFASLTDVDTNADGSMVYVVNTLAGVGNVWLKSSPWKRILSTPAAGALIVRVAPDDSGAIYVAEMGTTNVWVSMDGGLESWKAVPCYKITAGIADMEVLDADTVYMLDATGVSATTNGGASWGNKKSLDGLAAASDLALTPNGDILVGGTAGVAFSKDAGATFSKVINAVGTGAVTVIADSGYANNNTIFAADDGTGNIYRLAADRSAVVLPIYAPNTKATYGAVTGAVTTGMAVDGNVVYVLTSNGTGSVLHRATKFQAAATLADANWSYTTTSNNLNIAATPDTLVVSNGPKLWAIDSVASALNSMTDPIAVAGPTLNSPENNYMVPVNPESGNPYNVNFTFTRYASTSVNRADIQVATDPDFVGLLVDTTGGAGTAMGASDTVVITVGPPGVTFNPGDTYYWRARTSAGTLNSAWSAARSFKIEQVEDFSTTNPATGPAVGATSVGTMPTFTWAPYQDAIGYEIVLSEDPSFAIIEWSRNVDNAFYKVGEDEALKYSTTYYWRVRGVTGESVLQGQTWVTPAGPWITGVFTTMAEPVDETPEEGGDIIVNVPDQPAPETPQVIVEGQAIPTYLLWVIVAIGAILVIALIVLIVRTRRIA